MSSNPDNKKSAQPTLMPGDVGATMAAPDRTTTEHDGQVHLVLMVGTPVGRVYTLQRGMNVIGRDEAAQISLDDPGISRHHAMVLYDATADAFLIRDMDSRNGTRVNGQDVKEPRKLERGDKVEVGLNTVLRVSFGDEVETHFAKQMLDETQRDGLTGIYNRRKLELSLEEHVPAARAGRAPLAAILFDIDHFKSINDSFGHPVGDAVLKWLCAQVGALLAGNHIFARYGGEEFAVLCLGTDETAAAALAEGIRQLVAKAPCSCHGSGSSPMTTQEIDPARMGGATVHVPVTVSLGVAELVAADGQGVPLVEAADRALYAAKHGGRNRVVRFAGLAVE